tara:strand:- start:227 stop:649 length:423 start_codon:yes stop_codon:yes gene_type:complete
MAFTLHNVIDRRSSKVKILLANWEFNDNKLATILGVKYNEIAQMRKSAERSGSVTVEMKMSRLDAQIGKCKVIIDNKIEEGKRYVQQENIESLMCGNPSSEQLFHISSLIYKMGVATEKQEKLVNERKALEIAKVYRLTK